MTTAQLLIFLAVLAQALLTLLLYVRLVCARMRAARGGGLDMRRAGFDQSAWPERARLISNAVSSQFELPVLFYVGVVLVFVLGATGWLMAALAWGFVIARVAHMLIHTGSNAIMARLTAFLVSVCMVVALWAALTVHAVRGWLTLA